jgi:hypothetical protein
MVMTDTPADRILNAWVALETALRKALPVCSVAPPTQPSELLSALRIHHRIGTGEEERILALRQTRNRVAHSPEEPSEAEAARFEEEVTRLRAALYGTASGSC